MPKTNNSKPKYFYAAQHPRGWDNEWFALFFRTEEARDAWVEENQDDGAIDYHHVCAFAISPAQAMRRYRSNMQDGDALVAEEAARAQEGREYEEMLDRLHGWA